MSMIGFKGSFTTRKKFEFLGYPSLLLSVIMQALTLMSLLYLSSKNMVRNGWNGAHGRVKHTKESTDQV